MTVKNPSVTPKLDVLLSESGHQIKHYVILGYPCLLIVSFALTYIFVTAEMKYRCAIPECENVLNTSYLTSWLPIAIPFNKDGSPQSCYRYSTKPGATVCTNATFNFSDIQKCKSWVFQTDEINLLIEFNLECEENRWKLTLVGSLDGLGALIGTPICAIVSDKYGRRYALWIFSSLCIMLGILRSFSVNYYMYTFLDFCNAFLDFGIFGTAFVLCMELVGSYHRVSANIILNLFCCFGYVLLGAIGLWIRDWKWMLRFLYGSGVLLFFYIWIAPESIRWLVVQNRDEEAVSVVKNIIKHHPQAESVDLKTLLKHDRDQNAQEENLGYMKSLRVTLASSKLLLRLVHSSLCWVGIIFLWYGIIQQSVSLSGDKHLNFIYSALAQIPGYLASAFSLKLGHRVTLISSLCICSVVSFMFYFSSPESIFKEWLSISGGDTNIALFRQVLFLIGITGITSAFTVLYVNTVEMFPTPLRQSLLALCSMIGRVGQMIAPQVFLLGADLPLLIFGCVALGVSVLALLLPETLNLELPDTIEQAETIGRKREGHNPNYEME